MNPNRVFLLSALLVFATPVSAAQLLVLNKTDATLAFVDPSSGKASTTIGTGEGPHEIELSADGKLAFVSNYGSQTPGNTISIVDVQARMEVERDRGDLKRPHGLTLVDGRLYFTSEVAQRIARLDPKTRRIDWQFDTGQNGTHRVLASRDGSKLFASNIGSNSVGILAAC